MHTNHPQNPTCGLFPARSPPAESRKSNDESEDATHSPGFNAPSSTSALPVGRERRINSTKRRRATSHQNPTCGLLPARSSAKTGNQSMKAKVRRSLVRIHWAIFALYALPRPIKSKFDQRGRAFSPVCNFHRKIGKIDFCKAIKSRSTRYTLR